MIIGICMAKDEADIIIPVLEHLLAEGVDALIVADNRSSDGTTRLLTDFAECHPLVIVPDPEVAYRQGPKMTGLAELARQMGATWVLPFDADEVWYGVKSSIADALTATEAVVVEAWGYDHLPRWNELPDPDPIRRMGWRRPVTQKFPKVVFRAQPGARLHQGNHDVDRPGVRASGILEYRHYQYRSAEQMARKTRAGKAAYEAAPEIPQHEGVHWRRLGALSDEGLAAEWARLCDEQGLVFDPVDLALVR
jgi:glycosyl transferase family 2